MRKQLSLLLLLIMSVLVLSGCVSTLDSLLEARSPKTVLKKAEIAHNDVHSVEVSFEDKFNEFTETGNMAIDMEVEESFITANEQDMSLYITNDDLLIEYANGDVESWGDSPMYADLTGMVEIGKNPLAFYTERDADFFEKFDIKKEKDSYILTYEGSEEDAQYLAKAIAHFELTGIEDFDEDIDFRAVSIENFELELAINRSSYLLDSIEHKITYKFEDRTDETATRLLHEYENYNDIGEIKPLEANVAEGEGFNQSNDGELSEKDKELYESEAAAYVEALIEATVFQDVDGFIEKAPDSMSDKDKQDEAELQRDFFKQTYQENTQSNMEGTGVTEEEILDLTDAFLQALGTTEYEIVDAEATTSEDIIVTVSISGLDDEGIYLETEDQLFDAFVEENLEEDEIFSKNIELLVENYKSVDSLLDPVEVEVDVIRQSDGSYFVMMQDQFLVGGFVQ